MKKIGCLGILILLISLASAKDQIVSRYFLSIPEGNRIGIGISPQSINIDIVETNAQEQAAIIFSKLDSAFSIDKQLGLNYGSAEGECDESASVKYVVSGSIEDVKANFALLINNGNQIIGNNYIAFFSKHDRTFKNRFEKTDVTKIADTLAIKTNKTNIYAYGKGISSLLDEALDEAFNNAMIEYSKYCNMHLKSLFKEDNQKSKHTYELQAINRLTKLEISSVEFETVRQDSSLIHYIVRVELKKRIIDEDNSDNSCPLRFFPFGG